MPDTALTIRLNPATSAFEAVVEGQLCEAAFVMEGQVMVMHHTGVPRALEGRGIASQLVAAAVAHARANGLKVRPLCSYVRTWLQRHPADADLLEPR